MFTLCYCTLEVDNSRRAHKFKFGLNLSSDFKFGLVNNVEIAKTMEILID